MKKSITLEVRSVNPRSRELLTAALKWIRRIEERADSLPKSFLDNVDVAPLRKEIEAHLGKRKDRP